MKTLEQQLETLTAELKLKVLFLVAKLLTCRVSQ